jgi:hypothetical protein
MNNDAHEIPGRLLSRFGAIAIIIGIVIGCAVNSTFLYNISYPFFALNILL